ncbi:YcnI family copper-binding membrane protein [Streptomyces zingiberis]|uniref:YcnI family protein n=1 Tax=Streptomyces zingiberis TaxID=2053010 RepID=A0ABX1BN88_9ACTN|nr:YcnI family protein [Streptomyces zingiberis]NJP99175.1 YcnI family protein [Streptomyces zingiberis]
MRSHTTRSVRRVPVLLGAAAGSVLLSAGPALAHVSVQPGEAEQGGYATVVFKVPNERDSASTVKLEISLPADHPLASVQPQPVPGWDVKVATAAPAEPLESHGERVEKAVTKVTWSGGTIEPGMFQQFPLSVGRLPEDTGQLVFKALQTYDDDEVVRWIEEPRKDGTEPETPAPVLKLVPGTGGHGTAGNQAGDGKGSAEEDGHGHGAEAAGTAEAAGGGGTDTTARVLGAAGILLGAAGTAFGLLARRRRAA